MELELELGQEEVQSLHHRAYNGPGRVLVVRLAACLAAVASATLPPPAATGIAREETSVLALELARLLLLVLANPATALGSAPSALVGGQAEAQGWGHWLPRGLGGAQEGLVEGVRGAVGEV